MGKSARDKHNELGEEIIDPVPMAPPLNYKREPSLHEIVAQQIRSSKIREWESQFGPESEEEADDFEIEGDTEPMSKYENDHIPSIKILKQQVEEIKAEIENQNRKQAVEDYYKKFPEKRPPKEEAAAEPPPFKDEPPE